MSTCMSVSKEKKLCHDYVCLCVCMYTCMGVLEERNYAMIMFVYVYVCIYNMSTCMGVSKERNYAMIMFVCVYVCIYVYMYGCVERKSHVYRRTFYSLSDNEMTVYILPSSIFGQLRVHDEVDIYIIYTNTMLIVGRYRILTFVDSEQLPRVRKVKIAV